MYISNSMIHSFNDITKVFIEDDRNSKITSVTVYTDSNIKLKPIYEYNCAGLTGTADIYEDPKYKDVFFDVVSTYLCANDDDYTKYHTILTVSIKETDHDQVNIPEYSAFHEIRDIINWMMKDFNGGRVKIVDRKTKEVILTIDNDDINMIKESNVDLKIKDVISYLAGQFDVMEVKIDTGLNATFYVNRKTLFMNLQKD